MNLCHFRREVFVFDVRSENQAHQRIAEDDLYQLPSQRLKNPIRSSWPDGVFVSVVIDSQIGGVLLNVGRYQSIEGRT